MRERNLLGLSGHGTDRIVIAVLRHGEASKPTAFKDIPAESFPVHTEKQSA